MVAASHGEAMNEARLGRLTRFKALAYEKRLADFKSFSSTRKTDGLESLPQTTTVQFSGSHRSRHDPVQLKWQLLPLKKGKFASFASATAKNEKKPNKIKCLYAGRKVGRKSDANALRPQNRGTK